MSRTSATPAQVGLDDFVFAITSVSAAWKGES